MILGQQQDSGVSTGNRVDFTPPDANAIPSLPATGWYSGNIWPFSQVMRRTAAYPAYMPPLPPNTGPQALPPITPPTPPMAPGGAPAPGPTAGAFGGSGFGSHGGTKHFHVDPYMVMRSGWIPGVDPSGANIRAGYANAGARIQRSMPYQSAPMDAMAPVTTAPMPAVPPAAAAALPPAPGQTHGFGRHHFFHPRRHVNPEVPQCETVGPRVDGLYVTICNGQVVSYRDQQGNVINPGDFQGFGYPRQSWLMRNFGWRRRPKMHAGMHPGHFRRF